MTRRLGLAVLCAALSVCAAPAAQAQTEPVDEIVRIASGIPQHAINQVDPFCKPNYLTGEQCQAPDSAAAENECTIASWVGSATCVVPVADGTLDQLRVSYGTRSELDTEPSFELTVRDENGNVIHSDAGSGGGEAGLPGDPLVGLNLIPAWRTNGSSSGNFAVEPVATDTITCEITGTHASAGALHPSAHNFFGCDALG